jgi:hypothetical protein
VPPAVPRNWNDKLAPYGGTGTGRSTGGANCRLLPQTPYPLRNTLDLIHACLVNRAGGGAAAEGNLLSFVIGHRPKGLEILACFSVRGRNMPKFGDWVRSPLTEKRPKI